MICDRRCLSVCLSVRATLRKKTSERICIKFSGKVGNGPMNKWLNVGGDLDPYRDTGKTCLGGCMQTVLLVLIVPRQCIIIIYRLPNFISILSPITIQSNLLLMLLYCMFFLYFPLYCLTVLFGLTTTKLNKLILLLLLILLNHVY